MTTKIQAAFNKMREHGPKAPAFMGAANINAARERLASFGHKPTPLASLPALARRLGMDQIWAKDETNVLGLDSFKARGVFNAMALAGRDCCRQKLFVTATDGNHGLAVAAVARRMGHRAHVFMPHGSPGQVQAAIAQSGAQCEETVLNYDGTVRLASDFARDNGAILLQDTAWPGYEDIPAQIMAGYGGLVAEILESGARPSHVFLQAGVGSFASAFIAAWLALAGPENMPRFITVEPLAAACVYDSVRCGDGVPHAVDGALTTAMTGLACGVPSSLAWPILRTSLFAAMAAPDHLAQRGREILANPAENDPAIHAGPSGAIGAGVLEYLMLVPKSAEIRGQLGLEETSRVLVVCTESDRFFHNKQ